MSYGYSGEHGILDEPSFNEKKKEFSASFSHFRKNTDVTNLENLYILRD